MSILDLLTNFDVFLIPYEIFTFFIIVIIILKVVFILLKKDFPRKGITKFSNKQLPIVSIRIILVLSVLLCFLTILPIAGKGSDCPLFEFTIDFMRKNGPQEAFRTDRPLPFLITYAIGEVLNVPGRLSNPLATTLFSFCYLLSACMLIYVLTKNLFLTSLTSLFVVNSNIFRQIAICFVGNMLGLAFMQFFLVSFVLYYSKNKNTIYGYVSIILFILTLFSHAISALVIISIVIVFAFFELLSKNMQILKKSLIILTSCIIITLIFFVFNTVVFKTLLDLYMYSIGNYVPKTIFTRFLTINTIINWSSDYVWIFLFSIIGLAVIFNRDKKFQMLLIAWVFAILGLMCLSSMYAKRIFLYLPFSIIAALGLDLCIKRCNLRYKKIILNLILIFLILTPFIYFCRVQQMNRRYIEKGPFPWDTHFVETEQLRWILKNFDIDNIVVVTDVGWNLGSLPKHSNVIVGVSYRILAEVGNNVYFGKLIDLLQENPDCRDKTPYAKMQIGRYSSLNVDWTLENKTIIIPSTIYNINDVEKKVIYELSDGIYAVKDMTYQEKNEWIKESLGGQIEGDVCK